MSVSRERLQAWVAPLRLASQQPPLSARVPLVCHGVRIGDVDEGLFESMDLAAWLRAQGFMLEYASEASAARWRLHPVGDASAALNAVAQRLRQHGCCGPWRNEQLDVRADCAEQPLATIERGAVRPLGIATQAVHLIGLRPDGCMWVQQRALDKATHPGKWDTLMGGMVSSGDSIADALERETLEEAGLEVAQLRECTYGGVVHFACPSPEGGDGIGYMREHIHWYTATVGAGQTPDNRDGEVAQFQCLEPTVWQQWLLDQRFTPEASLVLADYLRL